MTQLGHRPRVQHLGSPGQAECGEIEAHGAGPAPEVRHRQGQSTVGQRLGEHPCAPLRSTATRLLAERVLIDGEDLGVAEEVEVEALGCGEVIGREQGSGEHGPQRHVRPGLLVGLTALQGLRTHGRVQPDDQVLVNGAAGGVGTFAVQIATALGAEVTAVCSTRNVEMVRSLGAAHVIDYTVDDFVPGGPRFDVMFDNVGNRTSAEVLSVLRPDARYVVITGPKENRLLGPVPHILRTGLAFRRAQPSFHQFTASPNHDDPTFLGQLLSAGKVVPQVDRVVGLEAVADGLTEIGTGHTRAKIVVVPD